MHRVAHVIVALMWTAIGLIRPAAARADFPTEIEASQLDSAASRYDCEKILISSPYPGLLLIPNGRRSNADGKYHQTYHAACHVYVQNPKTHSEYTQRFLVLGADDEARPLMARTARLLIILWYEEYNHLHHDHDSDEPDVQVWLSPQKGAGLSPDTGGEEFKNQIYIYNVLRERSSIEWTREIAHEYGHYALPGISGFKQPEEWANGVLGERLYLKWLDDDLKAAAPGEWLADALPFVTAAELDDYVARQVTPLIERMQANGVNAADLARRDADGMDTYTALALYIDTVYGSQQLLLAMSYTAPRTRDVLAEAPDFLRGFMRSVQSAAAVKMSLPVSAAPLETVVYLRSGAYRLDPAASARLLRVFGVGKKLLKMPGKGFSVPVAGWYHVTLDAGNNGHTTAQLLLEHGK